MYKGNDNNVKLKATPIRVETNSVYCLRSAFAALCHHQDFKVQT